jgi:hypothetical protein
VVMFAARHASAPRPSPPSPPYGYGQPQARSPAPMQPRLFDEEEEMARRGENPEWWRR